MAVLNLGGSSPQRYHASEDVTAYNPDALIAVLVGDTPSPDTPILPEGAFLLSGGRDYWFQRADGSAGQIDLLRGLTGIAPSPIAIATGLTNSGLASAIAADMISAGIAKDSSVNAPGYGPATLARQITQETNIPAGMLHTGQGVTTEIAALIATGSAAGSPGGVPLLNQGTTALGSGSGISLPSGGGFTTEGPFTITQPGYELYVSLAYAIAAPGGAPTSCTLIWKDAATGDKIEIEQFDLFPGASTGNAHIMAFKGPSKSNQCSVQFSNSDTLSAVNMSYVFWQNSRILPRSIGKTIQIPTMFAAATFFAGFGNPSRNIIGAFTDASLAANTAESVLVSVYNGDVMLFLGSGVGVNPPLSVQVYPVDNVGTNPPIYQNTQQTNAGIHDILSMPRAQLVFTIKNNDTVNAHAVNMTLVAMENGS